MASPWVPAGLTINRDVAGNPTLVLDPRPLSGPNATHSLWYDELQRLLLPRPALHLTLNHFAAQAPA